MFLSRSISNQLRTALKPQRFIPFQAPSQRLSTTSYVYKQSVQFPPNDPFPKTWIAFVLIKSIILAQGINHVLALDVKDEIRQAMTESWGIERATNAIGHLVRCIENDDHAFSDFPSSIPTIVTGGGLKVVENGLNSKHEQIQSMSLALLSKMLKFNAVKHQILEDPELRICKRLVKLIIESPVSTVGDDGSKNILEFLMSSLLLQHLLIRAPRVNARKNLEDNIDFPALSIAYANIVNDNFKNQTPTVYSDGTRVVVNYEWIPTVSSTCVELSKLKGCGVHLTNILPILESSFERSMESDITDIYLDGHYECRIIAKNAMLEMDEQYKNWHKLPTPKLFNERNKTNITLQTWKLLKSIREEFDEYSTVESYAFEFAAPRFKKVSHAIEVSTEMVVTGILGFLWGASRSLFALRNVNEPPHIPNNVVPEYATNSHFLQQQQGYTQSILPPENGYKVPSQQPYQQTASHFIPQQHNTPSRAQNIVPHNWRSKLVTRHGGLAAIGSMMIWGWWQYEHELSGRIWLESNASQVGAAVVGHFAEIVYVLSVLRALPFSFFAPVYVAMKTSDNPPIDFQVETSTKISKSGRDDSSGTWT